LRKGGELKSAHDAALLAIRPVPKTPPGSAVIDRDPHSGENDSAGSTLEGGEDVEELTEVRKPTKWEVTEALCTISKWKQNGLE